MIKSKKKMNVWLKNSMAVCGVFLMCVACEEDQTPHGVLPASIADVELGQTDDVRPGQPMTASIVLPTGGENLRSVEYYWRNGEEDLWGKATDVRDGKAYCSFTAAEEPGEHALDFRAQYVFVGPDASGNAGGELMSTATYTVVVCDVYSSKWGDSMDKTLQLYPRVFQSDANTCLGQFLDPLPGSASADTINRAFVFSDAGLSQITEFFTYEVQKPDGYVFKLQQAWMSAKKLGYTSGRGYYVDVDSPSDTTFVDLSSLKGDEREAVGERLAAGEVDLYWELSASAVDLVLSAAKVADGGVEYVRTFVPWR